MGLAVVTVASGGLPVVDVTAIAPRTGTPVTEASNGRGIAVTKVVGKPGLPVVFETIGVGPPSLAPSGLTGLIGWWDAQVTASMTLSGANIVFVNDQSGAGNHIGDGSTSNKPQYNVTGLNSRPAMVFTPSQLLIKTAFPMGVGNTLTFFWVGAMESASQTNARAISYTKDTSASHDWDNAGSWGFTRNGSTAGLSFVRNSLGPAQAASYSAPHRVIGTINSSGVMTLYVDGVAASTVTSAGNWVSGGNLLIGSGGGSNGGGGIGVAYWSGAFGECGIATGYHDATLVGQLDTYLKTKWGL